MITTVLAALAAVLSLATALSFLRIAHGFVRVFSFPRLQILVLALVFLAVTMAFVPTGPANALICVALIAVAIAQIASIVQFTPLRPKQSVLYGGDPNGPATLSLLSYNVKMSNRRYGLALALIDRNDPDIAVFMETDQAWIDGLEPLAARYSHVVRQPLDNAYGMVLFSRLPLSDVAVRCLVMEGVPSITATARLRDGRCVRIYCVHPEPPVPNVDSLGRDAELLKVADLVRNDALPALVTGDLNDVAWSHTTRLFQRMSRLLDPRIGRGFYSTFDARFPFLRWPLDHLFHDKRFQLVEMRRLPYAGSDHFPIFFKLALVDEPGDVEMPDKPDATDRAEAAEIKEEAKHLDRDPIGVDWET